MSGARPPRRTRTLADLVDSCLDKTMAAQGFAGGDVILSWNDIVGARLAAWSRPLRVEWPRRFQPTGEESGAAASLVVRVESAFALELQHLAPVLIERINGHYGWRCIGRIVLKQGPVQRPPPPPPAPPPASEATRRRVRARTADVADPSLRAALDRLGLSVVQGEAG